MGGSVSKDDLNSVRTELANYAKKSDLPTDYLKKTDIPTDYVKPSDLPAYALKTEIPQDYATTSDYDSLRNLALRTDIPSNYATTSDKQILASLTNYAKISDVPNVDLTQYLTQSDLENLMRKRGLWCTADGKICTTESNINMKMDKLQWGNYEMTTAGPEFHQTHLPSKLTFVKQKLYNSGPASGPGSRPVSGPTPIGVRCDKVRIAGNRVDCLNLASIRILDSNKNKVPMFIARQSSNYDANTEAKNILTEDPNTMAHTSCRDVPWIEIMIPLTYVSTVIILNRVDCCKERAIGYKVSLFQGDNNVKLYESEAFPAAANVYVVLPPDTKVITAEK